MVQKILYPQVKDAAVTMMKITFPPGETTGWHKDDIPVFSYILEGTLTVETEDHKITEFKENSCFAESYNMCHKGTNKIEIDLVVFVVYLSGDGKNLSIKQWILPNLNFLWHQKRISEIPYAEYVQYLGL